MHVEGESGTLCLLVCLVLCPHWYGALGPSATMAFPAFPAPLPEPREAPWFPCDLPSLLHRLSNLYNCCLMYFDILSQMGNKNGIYYSILAKSRPLKMGFFYIFVMLALCIPIPFPQENAPQLNAFKAEKIIKKQKKECHHLTVIIWYNPFKSSSENHA
jgi:hypothetical protein